MRIFFLLLVCIFLFSCSHMQSQPDIPVQISVEEPDRIRFSGKGAGAGMMLSSSMGPMGVAIGVAIDEGIAKEIDTTARAGALSAGAPTSSDKAFDIRAIMQAAMDKALTRQEAKLTISDAAAINILVKRYGFVLQKGGEQDRVLAELQLEFELDGRVHNYSLPAVEEAVAGTKTESFLLDDIKTNSDLIVKVFEESAARVCTQFLADLNKP